MSNQAVNDVFNAFVEAQKAMQKVPELEGQLAYHRAQHSYAESRNDDFRQEIDRKNAQIGDLSAKIASLEASLDTATFQTDDLRARFEMLLDTVRGSVKEVTEAMALVKPEPDAIKNPTSGVPDQVTGAPDSCEVVTSAEVRA